MLQPSDWYWRVGGDPDHVYCSARNVYIPNADGAFQTWLTAHGAPSAIDDEQSIWYYVSSVLPSWLYDGTSFAQPTPTTYTAAQLIAYANIRQWAKATAGHTVTIEGVPITFQTTPDSMNFLSGKVQRLLQPDPPAAVNWQIGTSAFKQIAAADFITAATQIADFIQSTFDLLDGLFGQIASGTVTTTAQIDAAFA